MMDELPGTPNGQAGELEHPFDQGDYASAALFGSDQDWRTFAAKGLIGLAKPALQGLARFGGPEARFYEAVTRWIDGDDAGALKGLTGLESEHARNLLALLRKPKIQVLSQCDRGSQWDFITSIREDKRFEVQNYGFDVNDQPVRPYADVRQFFDAKRPPDFYISKMLEWHLLPPNLQSLPCPVFGHTADYDLHIQAVHPWLSVFDEVLTTDQTEWRDVSQLRRGPVSVFPKAFGLALKLPPVPDGIRAMDVFISGTTQHPYHPDKARLIHQVLANPDLKVKFLEGFLPMGDYLNILGCSRGAFTYIRHPGGMPTRGMESLAMGAAIAVQKESILRAYLGESEGVMSYSLEDHDLPDVLHRITKEWDVFRGRALRGAEVVRQEFTAKRAASQYFRFLTFLAAKPRAKRVEVDPRSLRQRRSILCKGWSWRPAVNLAVRQRSLREWAADLEQAPSAALVISMARELVLEYATGAYFPAAQVYQKNYNVRIPIDRQVLSSALELYRQGAQRFPNSLVMRFNAIRAALHFGEPEEVQAALQLAAETLASPEDSWRVTPEEDVFPWDFFGQFFNYRSYFDRCTRALQKGEQADLDLQRLILGSIAYYLACYPEEDLQRISTPWLKEESRGTLRLGSIQRAIGWDPVFPMYRLLSARLLLEKGGAANDEQASALLAELVDSSMLHKQASELLRQLAAAGRCHHPRIDELLGYARLTEERMHQTNVGREDWDALPLRAAPARSAGPANAKPVAEGTWVTEPPPASTPAGTKPRILYLCLEFAQWQYAKRLAYPAGLGMEEGFRVNDVEWVTIPSVCGFSDTARKAWQEQVRRLCAGQAFDQVWIELVHSEWDEEFWRWVATLAPVRVGLVMESLRYDAEIYVQAPQLRERHARVVQRLSYATHALCIDDADADELNQKRLVAAMWWPQTVPGRFIQEPPGETPDSRALFSGAVYGTRNGLLQQPTVSRLLTFQVQPGEDATRYPAWFDELFRTFDSLLSAGQVMDPDSLLIQLETWRRIRMACFGFWLRGLQAAGPVVNLPSYVNSFAGRVFEAMAAGRSVVSWEMKERPRALELFKRDEEIAFFDKDDPATLVVELEKLKADPRLSQRRVAQAQSTLRRNHTTEHRVSQILNWLKTGVTPDYVGAKEPSPIAPPPIHSLGMPAGTAKLKGWLRLLAEVRSAQGEVDSGLSCLDAALAEVKSDPALLLAGARIAFKAEVWAKVRRSLEALLEADPRDRGGLRLLAEVCRHRGVTELAHRVARQLAAQGSDDLEVQVEAATAALAGQDQSGPQATAEDRLWLTALVEGVEAAARRFQERASTASGSSVSALGDLAVARSAFQNQKYVEAWDATWEAIRLRPFHPEAWLLQSQIARAAGDEKALKQCLARLRKSVPKWKAAKAANAGGPAAKSEGVHLQFPQDFPPLDAKPRLSVCLIVKNEERFIEACLKSVREIAHQLVVVDTGSTDRTVELAAAAGAEIHRFEWCDDFSAARNAALEHARGDWILVLDADEELDANSRDRLREAMKVDSVLAWRLPLADVGKEREGFHYIPRLFRNVPGARFTGKIHEHAFGSLEPLIEEWGMENRLGNAQLKHHGYSDQVVKERSKVDRNLRLLSSAIEEQPNDVSLRMSYGLELIRSGQLDYGLEEYTKAFAIMNRLPASRTPPELRERLLTLMASHFVTAQRFQSLIELSSSAAAQAAGPTASLHMLFGVAFYLQRKFDEAARQLKSCLAKRNQPALSPILPDIHSVAPRHMLALSYVQLRKPAEAQKEYRLALEEDPTAVRVRLDFARLLEQSGQEVPALEQLHQVITQKPGELSAWCLGAEIALRQPEFSEFAADWTAEAVRAFPRDPCLGTARAEVLLRAGEIEGSQALWEQFGDRGKGTHRAALVLCQLLTETPIDPFLPEQESMISQEVCGWFRRLVGLGAEGVVRRIGAVLPRMEAVLPTAASALKAVLEDAQVA